jgi:Phage tail assembly chaperone proteins, E, or 41 or 14
MSEPKQKKDTEPQAEAVQVWPIKLPLQKPLRDKDAEPIKELTLREPTGADIAACGNPLTFVVKRDGTMEWKYDAMAMDMMIGRLAGIPPAFWREVDSRDWNTAAYHLTPSFLPDLGTI